VAIIRRHVASLTIRRYETRDLDAVLSLHHNGLRQMNADLGVGPWDADLDAIEQAYLDAGGDFLVGELDGEVVAMAALRRVSEDTVEVKRLRVEQEFQGRGLGEQIARAVMGQARELGYTRVIADTSINQLPAQRLLAKLGFHETRRSIVLDLELIYYERDLL
jgi:RimJ/RimL family protein N-acetyltransferase